MSSRPFMQFYVSDFIGDTMHLSTEQVGAYLLLISAMWNAGGSLPNDETKLARITRMSVKKWRSVADDVLAFFTLTDAEVTHKRLTSELQKVESKSQSRSIAGAKGARAKSLKNNDGAEAIASGLLKHLPEPEPDIEESTTVVVPKTATQKSAKRPSRLSADWTLPDEWRADALTAGIPPQRVDLDAAKMRDWSVNAAKGAKLDWRAAWRNWCREAADRTGIRGSPMQSQPNLSAAFGQLARNMDAADVSAHHPQPSGIVVLDVPFRPRS